MYGTNNGKIPHMDESWICCAFFYETARGGCLLGLKGLDHFGAGKTFLWYPLEYL